MSVPYHDYSITANKIPRPETEEEGNGRNDSDAGEVIGCGSGEDLIRRL